MRVTYAAFVEDAGGRTQCEVFDSRDDAVQWIRERDYHTGGYVSAAWIATQHESGDPDGHDWTCDEVAREVIEL